MPTSNQSSGSGESVGAYIERYVLKGHDGSVLNDTDPEVVDITGGQTSPSHFDTNFEDTLSPTDTMVTAHTTLSSCSAIPDGKRKRKKGKTSKVSKESSQTSRKSRRSKKVKLASESLKIAIQPHQQEETEGEKTQIEEPASLLHHEAPPYTSGMSGNEEVPEEAATESITLERDRRAAESLNAPPGLFNISVTPGHSGDEAQALQSAFSGIRNELSVNTRNLIRNIFADNPSLSLPLGHSTISFTENQVGTLIQAVSEETSIASWKIMKDVLLRAAGLRALREKKVKPSDSFRKSKTQSYSSTSSAGDTTGDSTTDQSGTESEATPEKASASTSKAPQVIASPPAKPGPSELPPESPGSSQDNLPLGSLKSICEQESGKKPKKKKRSLGLQSPSSAPRHGRDDLDLPNNVMRESAFEKYEWARVFVTGPMDPAHNKYRFYCQICKYNVSMLSRGLGEIRRHFKRERHFRKDQRWRYEHLTTVHPITKAVRHHVLGRDAKELTETELLRELPFFENEELVDIGPKMPFYDDFMLGITRSQSTPELRASHQLSVFASFITRCGDLSFLRTFWTNVGTILNHQTTFQEFDWSTTATYVSIFYYKSFQNV